MTRKKPNPAHALSRFMHGIFDFYNDRGMPVKTAKARMYDETLQSCLDLMKKEDLIPDHAVVIGMQFTSSLLNARGAALAKLLQKEQDPNEIQLLRKALQELKSAKDQVDSFITTYKGVYQDESR